MVPYVIGKFLDCDVVMDDDQIVEQINQLDDADDLEAFDSTAVTWEVILPIETQLLEPQLPRQPQQTHQPQQPQQLQLATVFPEDTLAATQEPLSTSNAFEILEQCVNEDFSVLSSPQNNKERKNKSLGTSSRQLTHPVVIGLRASKATNVIHNAAAANMEVENPHKILGKKSARLAGLPPSNSTTF